MAEIELDVPNHLDETVLDRTRFETLDDFIADVLDTSALLAEMAGDVATEDRTVEVPADALERFGDVCDQYDDVETPAEAMSFSLRMLVAQDHL